MDTYQATRFTSRMVRILNLTLSDKGEQIRLKDWAGCIFSSLGELAKLLDISGRDYQDAVTQWSLAVEQPSLTLSGRVMKAITQPDMNHGSWVKSLADQYTQYFSDYELTSEQLADYREAATSSLTRQRDIEKADTVNFDDFLSDYFHDIKEG